MTPDAGTRNVASQLAAPASVLAFYRALLRFRQHSEALRVGQYRSLMSDRGILAFLRESATETLLVILNTAGASRDAGDIATLEPRPWRVAVGSHRSAGETVTLGSLRLEPFEALLIADC